MSAILCSPGKFGSCVSHIPFEVKRILFKNKKTMGSKGNAEVNYVHQNAILCETIKKEQRNHKLYTNYSINPFKKSKLWSFTCNFLFVFGTNFKLQALMFYSMYFLVYTLTGKPNSVHDSADGEEDGT